MKAVNGIGKVAISDCKDGKILEALRPEPKKNSRNGMIKSPVGKKV